MQGALAADAHMRRQRTTKASEWKLAEAKLNLLRMRSSFLLERMSIQADNQVPTFDPLETTPADAARLVRAQWRMPVGAVRNLTAWVESAGVLVAEPDLASRRIDGLSQWAGDYPVVLLNSQLPTDRKRWTLAHELGHLVLHSTWVDVDVEQQANDFAAEFLMPEHVIKPSLRNLTIGKLVELKREYGVSMQALIERAHRLGRVTKDERARFYKAMNARGWRTKEPASEALPPETPRLAASIGTRMLEAGLNETEIANLTGAREPDEAWPFLYSGRSLRVV
ncbi:MAG: ImmA/IrrE family metallo-endopeptidase [Dermatophilaceae bacterium]